MQMSPQGAQDTALESVSEKQSLNSSHDQTYDQSVSRRSSQDSAIGEKKPGMYEMKILEFASSIDLDEAAHKQIKLVKNNISKHFHT